MTINEMLLLDVGSEDEKIEYYKQVLQEERLRNPPPEVKVTEEDLHPELRYRRVIDSGFNSNNIS